MYKHVEFIIVRLYTLIFGRPAMQWFNKALFRLALHGSGYHNCGDYCRLSGEVNFMHVLSKFKPQLCIDVGANKGLYSEALLSITGSQIIAFEPLPKAFASLSKLQMRFPDRLIAINKGVGDKNAELDLYFGAEI